MKRTFTLLFSALICAAVARAGDVKIKAVMSTGPEGEPTTTFATDTPNIFAFFKTKGAKDGDKVRGVLIAEDVGDVAPANTKVFETSVTLDGDTDDGDFNFSMPTKGWPAGKYRVEIYAGDELATTVKFTIKAASKKKDSEESEGDDSSKEKGD
jgi:hypothetical protein